MPGWVECLYETCVDSIDYLRVKVYECAVISYYTLRPHRDRGTYFSAIE